MLVQNNKMYFTNIIKTVLCLISIVLFPGCNKNEILNQVELDTKKIIEKCQQESVDTIDKVIYKTYKNNSCKLIFRSEMNTFNDIVKNYYYNDLNRLELIVIRSNSSKEFIIPSQLVADNNLKFESGKALYEEYLSIFGLNKASGKGDCCLLVRKSKEEFRNQIQNYMLTEYSFQFTENEFLNLLYFVEYYCFNSPL